MTDGINLGGFAAPKVNDTPVWNGVQYEIGRAHV